MEPFTRTELKALGVIFLLLVAVSIPNFAVSLRRSRDQVRKDDMGALEKALGNYLKDYQSFPVSTADGRIVACKKPGDEPQVDEKGHLTLEFIPCEWGKDSLEDFMPGREYTYMGLLPRDPNYEKGASYKYISNGKHMQILVSLEGKDEPEYDSEVISREVMCGNVVCNAGRFQGCTVKKSLEKCAVEQQ